MAAFVVILTVITYAGLVHSILPPQCNANFRWDDCGRTPRPVIYYWRTGSRCEVGIWRGCLPNMNMFKNEYECVSTCVFTVRASDQSYHQLINEDRDDTENLPTDETTDENDVTTPSANDKTEPGKPGDITEDQTKDGKNVTDANNGADTTNDEKEPPSTIPTSTDNSVTRGETTSDLETNKTVTQGEVTNNPVTNKNETGTNETGTTGTVTNETGTTGTV